MRVADLNGVWELTYGLQDLGAPKDPAGLKGSAWPRIPASVPGNVELDLMAAGVLPDIFVGNNVHETLKYERHEWWYRRDFEAPAAKVGERVMLVFEGLDCFGTVWLNGERIGETDNMLIAHRMDVTERLVSGANQLVVRIGSALLAGRGRPLDTISYAAGEVDTEALGIRKARHMFGWDIMPRIVSAGLWRDVCIESVPPIRFEQPYWATLSVDAAKNKAALLVYTRIVCDRSDLLNLSVRVTIKHGGKELLRRIEPVHSGLFRRVFHIEDAPLWWPRSYGEPALCEATLELLDEQGQALAEDTTTIGLRTVELRKTAITKPDAPGEMVFLVNAERIYIRGTNWVPLDALHSRDRLHLRRALEMLADLNCNMVRCWGGNVYEDHEFFDFCDRNGILVWQDFALACEIPPQDDQTAADIRREAEAVIQKLRNHPSLAVWVGGNECDAAYCWSGLGIDPNTDRMSREVLPEAVRRFDPKRPYLPNSPWLSPEAIRGEGDPPEGHLWGCREDFRRQCPVDAPAHFVGEVGAHGCPDRRSIERFLDPEHPWPWKDNDQWLTKATRPLPRFEAWNYRIELMAQIVERAFGFVPENLDDFILASQIYQAEAFKYFVEWGRQGKWRHTGVLWWNLRDGWPIFSDAVVDYYFRPKLAYTYIQRVQADVCGLCAERRDDSHEIMIVNDRRVVAKGRVTVTDADGGGVLHDGDFEVGINDKAVVGKIAASSKPSMWMIRWSTSDGFSGRNHYLVAERPWDFEAMRRWLKLLEIPAGVGPERL
jgi:beta-mannosidase